MPAWTDSACFHLIYSYMRFSLYDLSELFRRYALKLHLYSPYSPVFGVQITVLKKSVHIPVKIHGYSPYNFRVGTSRNTYTSET